MPGTLLKPEIDAIETERRARELFNEWIKGWFDGMEHDTPGGPVVFPECEFGWGQTYPKLINPLIHFILSNQRPSHEWLESSIRVTVTCLLNVFVRVQTEGRKANAADHDAGRIAGLLKLIWETPSLRAPLTQKRILHPKVIAAPSHQAFPGFQTRYMQLRCALVYNLAT